MSLNHLELLLLWGLFAMDPNVSASSLLDWLIDVDPNELDSHAWNWCAWRTAVRLAVMARNPAWNLLTLECPALLELHRTHTDTYVSLWFVAWTPDLDDLLENGALNHSCRGRHPPTTPGISAWGARP